MSIADLFRVQKAAEQSQNPMDPAIGKSTSLPPQLLELLKQAAAAEQAQMRAQGQAQQQTPQQMPTVADSVRQKSAALMQRQGQEQQAQQEAMQQMTKAKQGGPAFAAGGIVGIPRYAEGGTVGIKYAPYRLAPMTVTKEDRDAAVKKREAEGGTDPNEALYALRDMLLKLKAGAVDDPNLSWNIKDAQERAAKDEMARETRSTYVNPEAAAPAAAKEEVPPAAAPAAAAPRRGAAGSPAGAASPGVQALKQALDAAPQEQASAPAANAAQQSIFGEYARRMLDEKGESPEAAIQRAMAMREQYGPKGAEQDFIRQQLAARDAEIAKAQGEKPGITQIIMAMAQAAQANDAARRGGSKGAALLGAASFLQGSKEARAAKVKELQAAKDNMLQKLAAYDDAKRSGDLQAVVAAEADARKAAVELKKSQATMATQFGTQEMQNQGANQRTDKEISARAAEGDKDRANRLASARVGASSARQAPAEIQLIERIAKDRGVSFTEAMAIAQGMRQTPKDVGALRREYAQNLPILKMSYPTVESYLQAMGVESSGASKPGVSAQVAADLAKYGPK